MRMVLVIMAVEFLTFGAKPAEAQTCAQLKAEIANLQQTLTNEKNALTNCNNHLGSCTPGQINGIQAAIQTANQEIAADDAKVPFVCGPPPPPNVDHVTLQGVEVTQAIQDLSNSVKLVAGKPTWVRVYFDKLTGTRPLTATLIATRGMTTVTLSPVAQITVDPADSLQVRRTNWNKSLNFLVPNNMISSGTTQFTLGKLVDPSPQNKNIICSNCSNPTQASFFNVPSLIVRAIGLSYTFTIPGGVKFTTSPTNLDFTLLRSWLGRAYPVSNVVFSQTTVASINPVGFTCDQANAQLAAIRANDVANGTDNHTHYYGLVENQGFYMRGCASTPDVADPSAVGSGPSGSPAGGFLGIPLLIPVNVNGDPDGSFADWYGGHELAHTFGRKHPGFCNNNTKDDPLFPYPNGQISDGTASSYSGLDTGDSTNGISLVVLWGGTNFDIMTYCQQQQWLSAYTYNAISQRLLDENPGFKELSLHPFQKPMATGLFVHIVARINLTKATGSFEFVTPVGAAAPPVGLNGRAELVVRNASGAELFRQAVPLQLSSDVEPGEDQTALVVAALPFRADMVQIDLLLDGTVVATYKNAVSVPPPIASLKAERNSDDKGTVVSWSSAPANAGKVTFTVEIPGSDVAWQTIAIGLIGPKVILPQEQAQISKLRVTASNGFRRSPPIIFNLCPDLMDKVKDLESQAQELQEAIDSGEVPAQPRTSERISHARAELARLVRELKVARDQLTRCQVPVARDK